MEDLALSKISDEPASCQDNPMSTGEFCHNSALQVVYGSKVHGEKYKINTICSGICFFGIRGIARIFK